MLHNPCVYCTQYCTELLHMFMWRTVWSVSQEVTLKLYFIFIWFSALIMIPRGKRSTKLINLLLAQSHLLMLLSFHPSGNYSSQTISASMRPSPQYSLKFTFYMYRITLPPPMQGPSCPLLGQFHIQVYFEGYEMAGQSSQVVMVCTSMQVHV